VLTFTAPAVALIFTVVAAVVATVVTTNATELLLKGTLTDVGTVTSVVELSERPTVNVPEVTRLLRFTVQVLDWPPITVEGAQEIPVNVGVAWTIVTVEPVLTLEMSPPNPEVAIPLVSCTFEEVFSVDGEIVNVTVATTPPEIAIVFRPYTTQVDVPATLLQESDLLAADAALPAATLTPEKSEAEYAITH
jgi:hypothetical protein